MPPTPLDRFRNQSLGVPLLTLVQDYESRVIAAYKTAGFDDVLRSHGAVLRYLGTGGARISDIAARAGITKQTVGRIVRDLERLGYVTVESGTVDRRVRLVRFSPQGEHLVGCSLAAVAGVRDWYSRLIGPDRFARFCDDLEQTIASLRIDLSFLHGSSFSDGAARSAGSQPGPVQSARVSTGVDGPQQTGNAAAAGDDRFYHFGRLLVELSSEFEARFAEQCAEFGLAVPSRPMLALFYCLDASGSSVSKLAARLPVTVQAVSLTVRQMARNGWLNVRESKNDSRAKNVRVSAKGAEVLDILNSAMENVHHQYLERVGKRRLLRLEAALLALANCLTEPHRRPFVAA